MKKCHLRHPKKCRFFALYRNCKFGPFCRFNHDIIDAVKGAEEIEKIKKQLDKLKRRIMEKDEEIDKINKTLKKRVDGLEKTNEAMEKQLEEIKAENMKIRDLLNSKKNGDEIVETENEDIEVEVEIENESDMEERKNVKSVNLLVQIKLG